MTLTEPNPDLAALVRSTPHGCAFWSGTGPAGKTCGQCAHHQHVTWGTGTTFRCGKYTAMMGGWQGSKRIPPDLRSCKYFEPKPEAAK